MVRETVAAFTLALGRADAGHRPQPMSGSALEYGFPVRDVCRVFDQRLRQMLALDDPLFPNWDQDTSAPAERYWTQNTVAVTTALQTLLTQARATRPVFTSRPPPPWVFPSAR